MRLEMNVYPPGRMRIMSTHFDHHNYHIKPRNKIPRALENPNRIAPPVCGRCAKLLLLHPPLQTDLENNVDTNQ